MVLNEEHSVSSEVMDIVDKIIKKIKGDISINRKCIISEVNNHCFYKGMVKELLSKVPDNMRQINVMYVIYAFDTFTQSDVDFLNNVGLNCHADDKTNTIKVVSYMVGNEIANDLKESLSHEVIHLYQYNMGFHKNENKYEKIITSAIKGNGIEQEIALTLYYSYNHEQDAYTHQFYSFLMHNKPFSSAEKCIANFYYFKQMKNLIFKILQYGRKIENVLQKFGYTYDSFRKYTDKQLKRFHLKLNHAYTKYQFDEELVSCDLDMKRRMINESNLQKYQNRNNGVTYELGVEPFYREYQWDVFINEEQRSKI